MNPTEYLSTLFSLQGKVAVVIGGTGELCGAMAEALAGAGAEAVLVGRNEEKARVRLQKIHAQGGNAYFLAAEADNKAGLEGLLAAVLARSKRVDIVINGAGINSPTPFLDISEEEFERIMRVNVKGVFLGCQVFGKYLTERGEGGSIINLGSMSGLVPLSRVFTY
jgi:NAD(P)-dependent dehydrogenase (short-subunit alcohol dehydrogenase family)